MAVRRHEIGEHGASERRDSKWQAEPDRHGHPSAILDLHFAVIGIFGVCGHLGWDGLRLISARAHIHDSPRKHWMAGEISIPDLPHLGQALGDLGLFRQCFCRAFGVGERTLEGRSTLWGCLGTVGKMSWRGLHGERDCREAGTSIDTNLERLAIRCKNSLAPSLMVRIPRPIRRRCDAVRPDDKTSRDFSGGGIAEAKKPCISDG
jgi:hypothetical protein